MLNLLPVPKNQHYLNRYIKLIALSKLQTFEGYTEKHHILPKSIFPQFSKDPNNLIKVSARIHFILHYLLWKSYRNNKTWNAFKFMISKNEHHNRYFNSKLYSSLKNEKMKLSLEHKQRISKSCKGIPKSESTKQKMSEWQKGKPKSYQIYHSESTKQKMSEWQKGKPKPQTSGSNNGMSKSISYNGMTYPTMSQCSKETGISMHNLRKIMQSNKIQ